MTYSTLSPNLLAPRNEPTALNLRYPPETAGRIMTTDFVAIDSNLNVSQALDQVRAQAGSAETIYTLYVVGPGDQLEGVVSLRELFVADGDALVADVMSKAPLRATADTDQEQAARLLVDYDFLALPVVNARNQLVGVLTVDDAIDVIEEEANEDFYNAGGLADITDKETSRSEVMVRGNLWSIWKVRLPFLVLTLVGGMLAARVVEGFEETLESVAAVAMFIPLIMDMGGSVGTQSSTVFARGVALGQIDIRSFARPFIKEVGVGSSLGVVAGLAGGLLAGLWTGIPGLGFAVGAALIVTMTVSALLGFLVPWVLVKMGFDHAAGSAPIITSIKDITGLIIYFSFVSIFLAHLL